MDAAPKRATAGRLARQWAEWQRTTMAQAQVALEGAAVREATIKESEARAGVGRCAVPGAARAVRAPHSRRRLRRQRRPAHQVRQMAGAEAALGR